MTTLATTTRRVLAPDLARGFMLLLIALAHAPLYVAATTLDRAGRTRDGSTADHLVAGVLELFVHNRSYPLFALLFGYGLVWQIRRARRVADDGVAARRLVRRRGLWLLVLGLGMALLVTPVEILGAYGVTALLVAGVVVTGERAIVRLIRVVAPISAVLVIALAAMTGTGAEAGVEEGWALPDLGYDLVGLMARLFIWVPSVLINVLGFPIVLMVLIGAWAAHRRLLEDAAEHLGLLRRVAVAGILVSVAGAVPLLLVGTGGLGADSLLWAQSLSVLTGLAGGAGYAAAFGLLGLRLAPDARWLAPVRATGQRSLTSYIVLELVLVVLLSSTFVGLGTEIAAVGAALVGLVAWGVAVLLATVLEVRGAQGPAERLLRRLVRR